MCNIITYRYDDPPNTPLYAFGHGLSYTDLTYSEIKLSSNTLTMDGEMEMIGIS